MILRRRPPAGATRLGEVIAFALRAFTANKLRSMLTTLGFMVGIAAMILLTVVGKGASVVVQRAFAESGTSVLTFEPLRQPSPGAAVATGALTIGDAQALVDPMGAPDIKSASPVVSTTGSATYQGRRYEVGHFLGGYPDYFATANAPIEVGMAFTESDVTRAGKVVVLGAAVARQLFGSSSAALGRPVLVNDVSFLVIGVLAAKGSSGLADVDDTAIAPLTTVENAFAGYPGLSQILVRAMSAEALPAARAQAAAILHVRHRISDPGDADFRVLSQGQSGAAHAAAVRTLALLLACVAAISLIFGGLLALGVTTLVDLFFGSYPASRAALLRRA